MTIEEQQLQVLQDIHALLLDSLPHLFNLIVVSVLIISCLIGFQTGNKR